MTSRTVLLTGAAGFVGAEITTRLVAAGCSVIALMHANPKIVRNNGREVRLGAEGMSPAPGTISWLRGDITQPLLGLPRTDFDRLRGAVEQVVHSGAITDLGRDRDIYQLINVDGTGHVLDLARKQRTPLVHVGTAYVCGEHDGAFTETDLDVGQRFANPYEESKFRAEQLVRRAGERSVPFSVVRPGIVVGAERSGVVREFRNMYVVIKALAEGKVSSIPGNYDATLDLVPVDYTADVIAQVALRFGETSGRTFHAVSGHPLTLRDFSDVMAEYPSFKVPRYVPIPSFDSGQLPPGERIYFERIISLYESYFRRRTVFTNDAALKLLGRGPATRGRTFLRRLFDYCLRTGYLGAALPGVDEVLASLGASDARIMTR